MLRGRATPLCRGGGERGYTFITGIKSNPLQTELSYTGSQAGCELRDKVGACVH